MDSHHQTIADLSTRLGKIQLIADKALIDANECATKAVKLLLPIAKNHELNIKKMIDLLTPHEAARESQELRGIEWVEVEAISLKVGQRFQIPEDEEDNNPLLGHVITATKTTTEIICSIEHLEVETDFLLDCLFAEGDLVLVEFCDGQS